ncbi:amino acid adenylation domain-containing protein [Cohnella sp.]|uniref:amino acid adenylation domain-containing protein n=1 Tax=Cohnella sp. TaxID=1883426 RepID=UPI0037043159
MRINLINYFIETVQRVPNKTAVIEGDNEISFRELSCKSKGLSVVISDQINHIIRKPIAVYLDKGINTVLSDIAITFTGNAYMNLDVKTPIQRTKGILDLIAPEAVITNSNFAKRLGEIWPSSKTINIDEVEFTNIELDDQSITDRLEKVIDTDPLCIINTSGSTGVPKGVILNHRSFIDFIEWSIETMKISRDEIVGSLSPSVFDIYSFELCMLMAQSSTMIIIQESLAAFPASILQLLQRHRITFIFWVPTIMVNISNMNLLSQIHVPELRTVWFAGEVFPTKQFNSWRAHLPEARFVNLYGPIEITLDCTYYIVDRELSDDEPIPIGYACKNTDVFILNDENQIAGVNEEGELCVRGTSLAMGYYNNPEKTAAAFVQNPLNKSYPETIYRTGDVALINERGEILFKGRKDTLIKHSGYRIELGEIEHVIVNSLKLVKNCCVIYDYSKKEIVLYYESEDDIAISDLKRCIGTDLPKYMLPTNYIRMDELPRNTNGKIDRLRLKELLNES